MNKQVAKNKRKARRAARTRSIIVGTAKRPRLSVARSNKDMFVQLIDDNKGLTICAAHTREIKDVKGDDKDGRKVKTAFELGKLIAKKAGEKKTSEVIFDRGSYIYHGRVKALAEGAREGGLKF